MKCIVCGSEENLRHAPMMTGGNLSMPCDKPVCIDCYIAWYDGGARTKEEILKERGLVKEKP